MLEKIKKNLYSAQKAQDTQQVSTLRFLLSAIQNKAIELRAEGLELSEEDVIKVVKKQIKQLNQTIEDYKRANRENEALAAVSEIEILQAYLPPEY